MSRFSNMMGDIYGKNLFFEDSDIDEPVLDTDNSVDEEIDNEIMDDLEGIELDDMPSEEDMMTADSDDDPDDIADDEEEELTDSEEKKADEVMALAATPILLKDELNKDDGTKEAFSTESFIAVAEGFLLESSAYDLSTSSSDYPFMEKKVFASKTRIQLNEQDRRKQLFEVGVQASARAHNDPVYWKLQKVYKLERLYKAKLRAKYRGEALKRVKAYIIRLKKSASGVLNNLANKIVKK